MDVKKFPMLIVGVVVALVLAGAVLPVFAETTSATDTFSNVEGSQSYMEKIGPDTENYTFVFDGVNNPGWITVNGVDVRPNEGTLFCVDNFGLIRNNRGIIDDRFSEVRLEFGNGPGTTQYVNISIINGVCSYIWGTETTPTTIDISAGGFGIIDKGDYVMSGASQHKYLTDDSEIYGQGLTGVSGGAWNTQLVVKGNIEDNVNVTCIYPPAQSDTVFSDIVIVKQSISGYVDLYDMDKITFVATYGENAPTDCTYNRVIIPAQVTVEKAVHPDGALSVMLNILPLLAIAGLVTGAVVWFLSLIHI